MLTALPIVSPLRGKAAPEPLELWESVSGETQSLTETHVISISASERGGCARILKLLTNPALQLSPENREAILEQACAPGRDRGTALSVMLVRENDDPEAVARAKAAIAEEQRRNIQRLASDYDYRRALINRMAAEGEFSASRAMRDQEELELNSEYLTGYIRDAVGIVQSPLSWDQEDWRKAVLIIAVTGGIYSQDEHIQAWAQSHRRNGTDAVFKAASPFGQGLIVPGLGLMYVAGKLADNDSAARGALLGLESAALTTVFLGGVKALTHRHRPYVGNGSDRFDGPSFSADDRRASFPSGHSGAAFAVASVLASEFGDRDGYSWVAPVAYGVATLTALSRVNNNEHWASDVFMGAAIGYTIGKWISHRHSGSRKDPKPHWQVYPVFDFKGNLSLALEYPF